MAPTIVRTPDATDGSLRQSSGGGGVGGGHRVDEVAQRQFADQLLDLPLQHRRRIGLQARHPLAHARVLVGRGEEATAGHGQEAVRVGVGGVDVDRLLQDAGIVRHRGKIEAAIKNAQRARELLETEPSLAAYFWRFEPEPASRPALLTPEVLRTMAISPESTALSKDLKKRGWRFVGPTTMYALMQAMGLVNDHMEGCSTREEALLARKAFKVPR